MARARGPSISGPYVIACVLTWRCFSNYKITRWF